MFFIEPHEDGFIVRWDSGDSELAEALGSELFFSGLRRTQETPSSFVVPRYRNELETLHVLTNVCGEQGIVPTLDPALVIRQKAGEAEQALLAKVLRRKKPSK